MVKKPKCRGRWLQHDQSHNFCWWQNIWDNEKEKIRWIWLDSHCSKSSAEVSKCHTIAIRDYRILVVKWTGYNTNETQNLDRTQKILHRNTRVPSLVRFPLKYPVEEQLFCCSKILGKIRKPGHSVDLTKSLTLK